MKRDRLTGQQSSSMNQHWIDMYGITIHEQCMRSETQAVDPDIKLEPVEVLGNSVDIEETVTEQILDSTVTTDKGTFISPSTVKQLRLAIAECKRAKIELITILGANEHLTISHYDTVMNLILQCEMHQLEVDLNK